jgi:hypothetical protein
MATESCSASPLDSSPLQKVIRLKLQERSQRIIPGGFKHTAREETENIARNYLSGNASEKQSAVSGS